MASSNGLGPDYDISSALTPVDLAAGNNTGHRLNMTNVKSVDIVLLKAAGTAGQNPVITLKSHTASTGGTTSNLAVITEYHHKSEATLDGDETWTRVTQAAAATVTGVADNEQIIVINVRADQLPQTDNYLSVDIADPGAAAQLGGAFYIIHKHDKGEPTSFPAPLR
ncbi:hypothetical protein [Streptomyces roseolus]|uniref:hypothetical protein n=1 Tax=Streptomyces roseolus TaxID=67358 RepID=UPI001679E28A|nr:hypothetical protein [Streptomyces roseolus]GGR51993.1 hypothetical protein GCM10010282_51200 [Streptomyces roseolus]